MFMALNEIRRAMRFIQVLIETNFPQFKNYLIVLVGCDECRNNYKQSMVLFFLRYYEWRS